MSEKIEEGFVDTVEDDLRKVEKDLERIGRKVCDVPGSATTHGFVNQAVESVQAAIHGAYLMRDVVV